MRSVPAAGALALAVLFLAPAQAQVDEKGQELKVSLENIPDPRRKGQQVGRFTLSGKTTPLPNGTRLHVTLRGKGKSRDVVCALFRVAINNRRFSGGQVFPGRTFAPMVYEVRVELLVHKQPKEIRKWIMKEYGYADEHRQKILSKVIKTGSLEERSTFTRKNILSIRKLVTDLEGVRAKVEGLTLKPAKDVENWTQEQRKLNRAILGWRRSFERYRRQYVVLLEQGYFNTMLSALKVLGRGVRDHGRGKDRVHKKVKGLAGRIKRIRESLDSRLPLQHPEDKSEKGK